MKSKLVLKNNPFTLGLKKPARPCISNALKLFPPSPAPTISINPHETSAFIPLKEPKYYYKTSKIQYEEDEIRKLFYKQHPFELSRPRDLNEFNKNIIFDRINPKGVTLCGESVVQYTLFLFKKLNKEKITKPLQECYKQALIEFYKERRAEEKVEAMKRSERVKKAKEDEAKMLEDDEDFKPDPLAGLIWSKAFMKHERLALKDSKEYKQEKATSSD